MAKFVYVPQRKLNDCWAAAFAMFAGLTYEEVVEEAEDCYAGLDLDNGLQIGSLLAILERIVELPVMANKTAREHPAVYCVLSPKDLSWGHAVYWDGERVWDPSPCGPHVTEEWLEGHLFAQFQRVRHFVELAGSRRAVGLLELVDREGNFLIPGRKRAA